MYCYTNGNLWGLFFILSRIILNLFMEVYWAYPKPPSLLLFKSAVFIEVGCCTNSGIPLMVEKYTDKSDKSDESDKSDNGRRGSIQCAHICVWRYF